MDTDCVFCRLLRGDGPAEWLWRGDHASALLPLPAGRLAPWTHPGHLQRARRRCAGRVARRSQATARLVQRVAQNMAAAIGATGVNVLNASGAHSDQSVDHLHFHVVPRWADDQLETWPRGRSSHALDDGWLNELRVRLAE